MQNIFLIDAAKAFFLQTLIERPQIRVVDFFSLILVLGILALWAFRKKMGERGAPHKPAEAQPEKAATIETTGLIETKIAAKTAEMIPAKTIPAPILPSWEAALKKSREPLLARLQDAWVGLTGGSAWGDSHPLWESLEEVLIGSDIGPKLTALLLDGLKQDFREQPDLAHLKLELRRRMEAVLVQVPIRDTQPASGPRVTLLMGVNGSGKTTTAGKLAFQAKAAGKKVVLGAGDTFRAAAVEQLQAWSDRIGVECIVPAKGANPAAVAFDTVAAGLARGADEIIIDTAGRLHTKDSLMEELRKVGKVIEKKIPGAPHRVLLVLDATLGQNAIIQAREFTAALPATGVVLTKLDGSAKGGAALSVITELGLPVELVGIGESAEALQAFSAAEFARNLIPDSPIA